MIRHKFIFPVKSCYRLDPMPYNDTNSSIPVAKYKCVLTGDWCGGPCRDPLLCVLPRSLHVLLQSHEAAAQHRYECVLLLVCGHVCLTLTSCWQAGDPWDWPSCQCAPQCSARSRGSPSWECALCTSYLSLRRCVLHSLLKQNKELLEKLLVWFL